ncbi:MAG: aminopeptidase P family protein [Gammaproteobacteria bacterium]|nr:aminopeptidase P family protein [Gammaproteobacteria bacterium]MCP4090751.1 aminopeptidase P family protein [Gammaproteobacteria bacterium]MCP4277178.1 aminopeptidase P family protein [Gammaproteobacteria bacterium]MCP4831688.1 aminopeptidase P family protein [Gammaproteobacteria bacterium]MCP4928012.1 aminopeptidase P family protein [Gammaproteobacteria bacterium]
MNKLLNHERAIEVMEREGLDGLVAVLPVNSFYLSNYWGLFNTPTGYDGCYFAVLPRDQAAPPALIVPALEIRRLETEQTKGMGTWVENIYAYSSPLDEELEKFADGTPRGADYMGWPSVDGVEYSELEQQWLAISQKLGSRMSPNAFWAVSRALQAAGLEQGKVATDDARTGQWLAECGLDQLTTDYRPELFNEIRLIKTPAEIEIMRQAAHINEMSLLVAAESMQVGSTWAELENMYMMSMAQQSGRGVYLMCGVGELPATEVRRNEPVFFDALGQYQHYHGDFGRCAVVGEGSAKLRKHHAHLLAGWDVAQENLRPGVSYSDLGSAVGAAVRKAGINHFRDPVVHSVGLEHTDDPKYFGVQPQTKVAQVLQPGMIVNLDMPHTEIGWGSIHMEDTVLITTYGFERLSDKGMGILYAADTNRYAGV